MSQPSEYLSRDGRYWWNGQQWCSALSPDGTQRWDGTAWVPSGQDATAAGFPTPPMGAAPAEWPTDVDDARWGEGTHPDTVKEHPPDALYDDGEVATGPDWIAHKGALHWRVMPVSSIKWIALCGPTALTEMEYSRSIEAPKPSLAIRDDAGHIIRTEISHVSPGARAAIVAAVRPNVEVTAAADAFLRFDYLPGKWAKHYQFMFARF